MGCREHKPRTPQTFWCNHCDSNRVDSEKSETGSFYVFFGHTYKAGSGEYDGEYMGVMLAICTSCSSDEDQK